MKSSTVTACSLFVALTSGCAAAIPLPPKGLDGTWLYVNGTGVGSGQGNAGEGLTIRSDGTYVISSIVLTSSDSADVQLEAGNFALDGNTAQVTPTQTTCAGFAFPAYSATFDLNGDQLTVATAYGVTVFERDTAISNVSFSDTFGCFEKSGFVPQPLAPVQ